MDPTKAADVTIDGHVVRRVREDEFGLGAFQHAHIGGRVARVAAKQTVLAEDPQIPSLGDGRPGWIIGSGILRAARSADCLPSVFEDEVYLRNVEPGQLDREVDLDQPL